MLAPPLFIQQCKLKVNTLLSKSYAEASKTKAIRSIQLYITWCDMAAMRPHEQKGGITDAQLAMYVAWLSTWLAPDTIAKYISMGVRLVHEAMGIKWIPPSERLLVRLALKGARAERGDTPPKRKLPMTLHLLAAIRDAIDLRTHNAHVFWAACLMLFFCCLRKAHVTVKGAPTKQLMLLGDIRCHASGKFIVSIRHTKTRQHNSGLGANILQYVLPEIPGSLLCPTKALTEYLLIARPHLTSGGPLFVEAHADEKAHNAVAICPLRYAVFIHTLKQAIEQAGLDPTLYAGQSFRRGGATFALDAGVSETVVRAMGDWKSDVWRDYVSATAKLRENASFSLARAVLLAQRENDPIIH